MTRGLEKAGIHVSLGVDIDPDCEYPYAINNRAGLEAEQFPNSGDPFAYALLPGGPKADLFAQLRDVELECSIVRTYLLR